MRIPVLLIGVAAALTWVGCAHDDAATDVLPDVTPLRGVDFLAVLAVLDTGRLTADVHVTNRRETPVALEFPDACPALLRAYPLKGDRVAPVWDQGRVAECEGDPAALEIGAGAAAVLRVPQVGIDRVIGDSVPPGTYRFTVYLRPGGQVVEVAAGTAALAID